MDKLEAELARLRKLKGKKLTSMMKSAREDIQKLLEVRKTGRAFYGRQTRGSLVGVSPDQSECS